LAEGAEISRTYRRRSKLGFFIFTARATKIASACLWAENVLVAGAMITLSNRLCGTPPPVCGAPPAATPKH